MSIPWLAFTGFTIAFCALFSKTWRRVNQLFNVVNSSRRRRSRWSSSGVGGGGASSNSSGAFEHVKVSEYDVLVTIHCIDVM